MLQLSYIAHLSGAGGANGDGSRFLLHGPGQEVAVGSL